MPGFASRTPGLIGIVLSSFCLINCTTSFTVMYRNDLATSSPVDTFCVTTLSKEEAKRASLVEQPDCPVEDAAAGNFDYKIAWTDHWFFSDEQYAWSMVRGDEKAIKSVMFANSKVAATRTLFTDSDLRVLARGDRGTYDAYVIPHSAVDSFLVRYWKPSRTKSVLLGFAAVGALFGAFLWQLAEGVSETN